MRGRKGFGQRFLDSSGVKTHVPDFLADCRGGVWLLDVRPAGQVGDADEVCFAAVGEAALAAGWAVCGGSACNLGSVTTGEIKYNDYDGFAQAYASHNESGPFNALYERPATLSLAGDVHGLRVLDAGCGSGLHAAELMQRGATVTGVDLSVELLLPACGSAQTCRCTRLI